jgi:hypothetical protein
MEVKELKEYTGNWQPQGTPHHEAVQCSQSQQAMD